MVRVFVNAVAVVFGMVWRLLFVNGGSGVGCVGWGVGGGEIYCMFLVGSRSGAARLR